MRNPSRSRRSRSTLLGVTAGLLLVGGSAAAAATPTRAAPPAGTSPTLSGWIVVRDATASSGTPAPMDRGNSAGGVNHWTRHGVGDYTVTFPGIAGDGGHVQVTPIATRLRHCQTPGWGSNVPTIDVRCYDRHGSPRDTRFVVTFTEGTAGDGGSSGRLAYYWMDDELASSTPSSSYQYVSNGDTITVVRPGTGRYEATIPGLGNGLATGSFQVTTYDAEAACKIDHWGPGGTDLLASVRCRSFGGTLADATNDVLFLRKLGPEGYGGGPAAYLWASDKHRTTVYHPNSSYAWSSNGRAAKIQRLAQGVYQVTLPGMPRGGAGLVTGYGRGASTCQLGSIRTDGTPQRIVVRCFKPDGSLVDSAFTLAWTK